MKTLLVPLSLLLLAAPLRAEGPKTPSWIDDAAAPGYRAAENVTDGLYNIVRGDIIGPIMPKLSGEAAAAPEDDSYATFSAELSARQARAARRDWEARPAAGSLSKAEIDGWLAASIAAHRDAVLDAFVETMMRRYRLESLGTAAGDLMRDPSNWNADTVASAAVVGGVYAYFAGVRTDFAAGPMRVELDLVPGESLRSLHGSGPRHLARLGLSKRGIPLTLNAEMGATQAANRVGANWTARF